MKNRIGQNTAVFYPRLLERTCNEDKINEGYGLWIKSDKRL